MSTSSSASPYAGVFTGCPGYYEHPIFGPVPAIYAHLEGKGVGGNKRVRKKRRGIPPGRGGA